MRLSSLLAAAAHLGSVSARGIPGPWEDAALAFFYNTSATRASASAIAACHEWPAGAIIPWSTIVADWAAGGGRAEDCAAALIIASGETACTRAGCESVQSGIWQVTSPDEPAPSGCLDGDTNPCCTVEFVRNHVTTYRSAAANSTKTTSWQVGCMGEFNKGNGWPGDPTNPTASLPPSYPVDPTAVVPVVVPADHSGGGLGGTQENFIGPFCHAGGFTCEANDPYCTSKTQANDNGDNWGGGSLWYGAGGDQIYPFPYYYYARFVESQGDGAGTTGDMFCATVLAPVGQCGGVAAQGKPNCSQPVSGVAPTPDNQACLDSITSYAIALAQGVCKGARANT